MRQIKNKYKQYPANVPKGQDQKTDTKQKNFARSGILTSFQVHAFMQPKDLRIPCDC